MGFGAFLQSTFIRQLKTIPVFLILILLSGTAECAETIAQSGPEKVALLEVYSSEGCSSCPPAEEWISRLKKDNKLWKDFVPAVFHVDYWNDLGWKDKFSRSEYTDRQKKFAFDWRSNSVYTPGFVLNGKEWKGWVATPSVPKSSGEPGLLSIGRVDANTFIIRFVPIEGVSDKKFSASAALLESGIVSNVTAGENSGRRLVHDFTVLHFTRKAMSAGNGGFETEVTLEIPSAAGDYSMVAWVTAVDSGEPIQAAGCQIFKNS